MITLPQKLVVIAYIVLITFSPSIHFISYIAFHDCQRILQLLLLSLVLIDAIYMKLNQESDISISPQIKLALFTLLGLAALSSARSIEPRQAIIEVTIFVSLCYLAFFVARLYRISPKNFIICLTYAILSSVILYLISFYVGYITAISVKKAIIWPAPFFGFNNIRLFQQYQLWGLGLISLPLLAFDLKKIMRIWLYVALVAWWVLLFYAASRGVTLGWLLAMLVTAIVYRNAAWSFLKIQLITSLSGLVVYFLLFHFVPLWIAPHISGTDASSIIVSSTIFRDTTYDRIDLWKVAYVMIKNFPLLGVGPMHFYYYNSFGTHPHNSLLQLASEFGLPAALIMVWIVGNCAYFWYKRFNASRLQFEPKLNANLAIILFFTMIANGAYSLVEGVIVMPISQVLMFTMIGLMIGQYTSGNLQTDITVQKNNFRFRPFFAVVVLILMSLSVMPEILRGLTSYERYYQPGEQAFSMGPGVINPRIWMQQRRIESNKKSSNNKDAN